MSAMRGKRPQGVQGYSSYSSTSPSSPLIIIIFEVAPICTVRVVHRPPFPNRRARAYTLAPSQWLGSDSAFAGGILLALPRAVATGLR